MRHSRESQIWFPAIASAICLSACCWIWLLYQLRKQASNRLFQRQLRSLGVAGLLLSVTVLPVEWMQDGPVPSSWPTEVKSIFFCSDAYNMFRAVRLISVLQETHLAATFLAQSARCHAILRVFNRGIPVVWVLGLLLGIFDALLTQWEYNESTEQCMSTGAFHGKDVISIGVLVFCMVVSLVTCVGLCWSTWKAVPGSVQRRSVIRAIGYPVISVVSYLPMAVAYVDVDLFSQPPWYHPLAALLHNCNGILNVAWASYALRLCCRSHVAEGDGSPGGSAGRASYRDALEHSSFHVLFRGVDVEVFDSPSLDDFSMMEGPTLRSEERPEPIKEHPELPEEAAAADNPTVHPGNQQSVLSWESSGRSRCVGQPRARSRSKSAERSSTSLDAIDVAGDGQSRRSSQSRARSRSKSAERSSTGLEDAIRKMGF